MPFNKQHEIFKDLNPAASTEEYTAGIMTKLLSFEFKETKSDAATHLSFSDQQKRFLKDVIPQGLYPAELETLKESVNKVRWDQISLGKQALIYSKKSERLGAFKNHIKTLLDRRYPDPDEKMPYPHSEQKHSEALTKKNIPKATNFKFDAIDLNHLKETKDLVEVAKIVVKSAFLLEEFYFDPRTQLYSLRSSQREYLNKVISHKLNDEEISALYNAYIDVSNDLNTSLLVQLKGLLHAFEPTPTPGETQEWACAPRCAIL